MGDEQNQTTLVKSSNIGFVLGILLVVALGMYLYKSGYIARKFGRTAVVDSTPTPQPTSPLAIDEEPITLLEEDGQKDVPQEIKQEKVAQVTHQPVDTAMGDNPLAMLALLFGSAGVTYIVANKLGV